MDTASSGRNSLLDRPHEARSGICLGGGEPRATRVGNSRAVCCRRPLHGHLADDGLSGEGARSSYRTRENSWAFKSPSVSIPRAAGRLFSGDCRWLAQAERQSGRRLLLPIRICGKCEKEVPLRYALRLARSRCAVPEPSPVAQCPLSDRLPRTGALLAPCSTGSTESHEVQAAIKTRGPCDFRPAGKLGKRVRGRSRSALSPLAAARALGTPQF